MRARTLALVHGLFYVTSGLWPVIHERSFEAVTGPKRDRWLVRTTGLLIGAVGVALLAASRERVVARPSRVLGFASALALGAADVVFTLGGKISRVYLLDAVAEGALASSWARQDALALASMLQNGPP